MPSFEIFVLYFCSSLQISPPLGYMQTTGSLHKARLIMRRVGELCRIVAGRRRAHCNTPCISRGGIREEIGTLPHPSGRMQCLHVASLVDLMISLVPLATSERSQAQSSSAWGTMASLGSTMSPARLHSCIPLERVDIAPAWSIARLLVVASICRAALLHG